MNNFKRVILPTALCCALFLGVSCEDADETPEVKPPPVTRETPVNVPQTNVVEVQKTTNVPIEFYGAVIDERGKAVELAEVMVDVKVHNKSPMEQTEIMSYREWTDSEGRFSFQNLKGSQLTIRGISRDGYKELESTGNPGTEYYYSGPGRRLHLPSLDRPVTFTIHEQVEPSYLIHMGGEENWEVHVVKRTQAPDAEVLEEQDEPPFWFNGSGTVRHDFARKSMKTVKAGATLDGSSFTSDLEMTISFNEVRKRCRITLGSPGQGNGVIVSKNHFNQAPQTGYRQKAAFQPPPDSNISFIYVKSRNPSIYSVVELTVVEGEDNCQLTYTVSVNPYGGTGFEQASGSAEELEKFEEEAVSALNRGELPEKPPGPVDLL